MPAETGLQGSFSYIDWGIIIAYMLGTVLVGLYVRRYVSNMADYIVAGRALKSYLGIATMIGTELGLVTVMYSSQKGYTAGFAAFHIALAAAVVTLVVGFSGFIVVPLRRMGVMTIPEFYEKRFGRSVRIAGGLILALSGILNMGMFLKAGSLFVMGVTGMTSGLHLKVIMTVLLAIVLFYTILGGMISVVITDYVQFVVLSVGLLLSCLFAVRSLGWNNIVETIITMKGRAGFDPFGETFGTSYIMWMVFMGLVSCAIWQTAVMRACAAESEKVVKRVYIWSSVGFLIRFLIPYFLGICAFVYFSSRPEVSCLVGRDNDLSLMAMPVMLSRILPVGMLGLITAGMLAAFMSTHDSYLLCWSSVLTQDVAAPILKERLSTRSRLLLTRIFIFLIGVFLLIWGLWYPLGEDLWDYMTITGAVYAVGAFSLLVFGLYWKKASRAGAMMSLISGISSILGLNVFLRQINRLIEPYIGMAVSHATVCLAALALSVAVMIAGSFAFPDDMGRSEKEGN
ncbi:MAG: sodium:solute symporter family protein [Planctomycetota bacterium]